eukprot:331193-Pelagomonas_calceolata.AAC.1
MGRMIYISCKRWNEPPIGPDHGSSWRPGTLSTEYAASLIRIRTVRTVQYCGLPAAHVGPQLQLQPGYGASPVPAALNVGPLCGSLLINVVRQLEDLCSAHMRLFALYMALQWHWPVAYHLTHVLHVFLNMDGHQCPGIRNMVTERHNIASRMILKVNGEGFYGSNPELDNSPPQNRRKIQAIQSRGKQVLSCKTGVRLRYKCELKAHVACGLSLADGPQPANAEEA